MVRVEDEPAPDYGEGHHTPEDLAVRLWPFSQPIADIDPRNGIHIQQDRVDLAETCSPRKPPLASPVGQVLRRVFDWRIGSAATVVRPPTLSALTSNPAGDIRRQRAKQKDSEALGDIRRHNLGVG
jgi:hypothetical protein